MIKHLKSPRISDKSMYDFFHKMMRFLVISVGVVIPIIAGYWRYSTSSESNAVFSGLFLGGICLFFSFGLWLSITRIGKKLKWLTLICLLIGIPLHMQIAYYPFNFLLIALCTEIYAFYSLFKKDMS